MLANPSLTSSLPPHYENQKMSFFFEFSKIDIVTTVVRFGKRNSLFFQQTFLLNEL